MSNLDYAYIAAELGKSPLSSESLNCSAPDTGNMEVLERVGTPEQKEKWLKPLLNGEIRSAYAMTEPDLASSDAKNIGTRAVLENGEWVINGEKFYISGAGDPRCKIMICMVKTSPDAAPHRQQVHMVKAMVPERVCQIIDQAIQIHGAAGVSQWWPLAKMYKGQRTLRLADGPDEVHHLVVGRAELRKYGGAA